MYAKREVQKERSAIVQDFNFKCKISLSTFFKIKIYWTHINVYLIDLHVIFDFSCLYNMNEITDSRIMQKS